MTKSAQQAVYDWTFKTAQGLAGTYDHLPMQAEHVSYPFINLGTTTLSPEHTKERAGGTFSQAIDVWGSANQRLKVSAIADQLMTLASRDFTAYGYHLSGRLWHHTCEITTDQSVPNAVFHRATVTLFFALL